jgi:hypothetical protein
MTFLLNLFRQPAFRKSLEQTFKPAKKVVKYVVGLGWDRVCKKMYG